MADDNGFAFSFPAIRGRKITAAFDGGRLTSDGGVLLLGQGERRLGIADGLVRLSRLAQTDAGFSRFQAEAAAAVQAS